MCLAQIADLEPLDSVTMQVNIDGVPVFKSNNGQFWPIQGMVDLPGCNKPFLIGLFYGVSKPKNLDFLNEFIQDFNELKRSGLEYNGSNIKFDISLIVCDAPARSFIKSTKQHSGYSSCERCTQRGGGGGGVWDGRMTFPDLGATLRTNVSFDEMTDDAHHLGPTPFSGNGIGLVTQVVLDYMHLVCLGVMRRLIMLRIKGPLHCRQGNTVITSRSDQLLQCKHFIPSEFARRPRPLSEFQRWKATEFRQFLLYTGQVVLAGQIPDELLKKIILLSVSIHILVDRNLCSQYNAYARDLLVSFVRHFSELYVTNMVGYNIHNLIHLAVDVARHGPLDGISAFPFENAMGDLLRKVRKPSMALEHVVRRVFEVSRNTTKMPFKKTSGHTVCKPNRGGFVPQNFPFCSQFKELRMNDFSVNLTPRNNCLTINEEIVLVRNILSFESKISIVCQRFRDRTSFFSYPVKSDFLGIFQVWNLDSEFRIESVDNITPKNVILPYKQRFIVIPLIHLRYSVFAVHMADSNFKMNCIRMTHLGHFVL